jgi:hypothetical protein
MKADVRLRRMDNSFRRVACSSLGGAIFSILHAGTAHAQTTLAPTYSGPPPAYPATEPPPLQTGGLTPPPTSARPPEEAETLARLERAEREDAGRGLEFVWLNAEAGYQYLSLQAFHDNSLLDGQLVPDAGSGFSLGVGAGVRLIFLTFGARFRLAQLSAWDLWTLNAEVGLHLPLGVLEPSFTFSAGYASLGAVEANAATGVGVGGLDASGFDARLGAALDWYINPLLSIGAQSSFEVLVLSRDGASQPALTDPQSAPVYSRDGDGIGLGLALTGVVGLHF